MFNNLVEVEAMWKDAPEEHKLIFQAFFLLVNADAELKAHRDFVEQYNFGYGDRPFHWMWNLIVKSMPENFKFLEVGVYQGQVISLVSLLSKRYGKNGSIVGVSPLKNVDDAFSKHPDLDYEQRIALLYAQFGLDMDGTAFVEGLSTDLQVKTITSTMTDMDCVYIDGGHDYNTVVSDIEHFAPLVKVGGLLVMDDSANYLQIPDGLIRMDWRGLMDVSNAVRDRLETDKRFVHIFNVGHNRVWRRVA